MLGIFSRLFHEETNFKYPIGTLPLAEQYWPKEWTEIYHKEYPRFSKIELPKKFLDLGDFENALSSRHSTREFDLTKNITIEELSTLLYYSAGVKPSYKNAENETVIRRHYPSGGARYPLEVYLGIQRVKDTKPGIYHYNVKDHILETLTTDLEYLESLKEGFYYPWSQDAAVILLITVAWNRNMMKYQDRGYRIILMEAGHLAQNLALIAAALNIGCCNSVGFHNQRINEVLDIEHEDEDSLYMAVLGK